MIEDTPIYRIRISADKLRSATALNPATELKVTADAVEATIEEIHEVILLAY